MDGDPEAATHRRVKAEYSGEDTRLTSKKELAGWYCYGFAAEVFVICGMGKSSLFTLERKVKVNARAWVRGDAATLVDAPNRELSSQL